jgi:hypothetical protein
MKPPTFWEDERLAFCEDETAYAFLPEGVWILAQDKRSAVLGEH